MHAQIQIFLSERWGGGGSKPNGEKTALIFLCLFLFMFMFVFGSFSPKFSGDAVRGPTIYEGGGGPNANFYRI